MKKLFSGFRNKQIATKFGICLGILGAVVCLAGLSVMCYELVWAHPMDRQVLQLSFHLGFLFGILIMVCGAFGCAIDVLAP